MRKWYIVCGALSMMVLIWFVYNVFFIREGDVVLETESPTGEFKVFVSEKESFFSSKPKYVAAYAELNEQGEQTNREIFYYSPESMDVNTAVEWKNRDTLLIGGHELRLPYDRYHYFIR